MVDSLSNSPNTNPFLGTTRHTHVPHSGSRPPHDHNSNSSVRGEHGSGAGSLAEGDTAEPQRRGKWVRDNVSSVFEVATRDLRELSNEHDDKNLRDLNSRTGIQLSSADRVNLQSMKEDLRLIKQELNEMLVSKPKLAKRFSKQIETAEKALAALDRSNQRNPLSSAKITAFSIANTALLALPWLLATDPMKVKNVGPGESRLSKEFMLVMAGYQAKSLAIGISHVTSPAANMDTLAGYLKERQAYDVQAFATGAAPVFSKKVHDAVDGSTAFTMGRAATSAIALNALFQTDELGRLGNRIGTGLKSLIATGSLKNSTAYPRLEAQSAHLGDVQKEILNDVAGRLDGVSKTLKAVNDHFADSDRQPSMAWDEHTTNARRALTAASIELRVATGTTDVDNPENHDQSKKAMLSAVGALVYAANVALVSRDPLAVADVVGDALFSMPILLVNAFDPSVSAKGAKDAFKSFVGTSLLSAIVLGINALADDPIGRNDNLFFAMMPIFAGLALTMPSPTADALVNVLERAYDAMPSRQTLGASADDIPENLEMLSVIPEDASEEGAAERLFDANAEARNPSGVWPFSGESPDPEALLLRHDGIEESEGENSSPTAALFYGASTAQQRQELVDAGAELLANTMRDESIATRDLTFAIGEAFTNLLEDPDAATEGESIQSDQVIVPNVRPDEESLELANLRAINNLQDRLARLDDDLAQIDAERVDHAEANEIEDEPGRTALPG